MESNADTIWRDNYQNAWAALRMIRETTETQGPPGVLMSEEAVLLKYGPEPVHEGQAIVEALTVIFAAEKPSPPPVPPSPDSKD
ncbi:MAG: hypothetical protein NVS2B5_05860 [Beijerinckiaceae bacterium]